MDLWTVEEWLLSEGAITPRELYEREKGEGEVGGWELEEKRGGFRREGVVDTKRRGFGALCFRISDL